jgi:hypothetical protein
MSVALITRTREDLVGPWVEDFSHAIKEVPYARFRWNRPHGDGADDWWRERAVQSLLRRDEAAHVGIPPLSASWLGRDALRVWNVSSESLSHGVQSFSLPSL